MAQPKIAVMLSGCGVYDGSEIHESVLTLLALEQSGASYQCVAPDIQQHHVINHLNGEEMSERREVLVESARIARGNIQPLDTVKAGDYDGLTIPGGFGAAKNLTKWAFAGPDGEIDEQVKRVINEFVALGKPVLALCMGPTVVAKALEGSKVKAELTVGTTEAASPYDINAISEGMAQTGATAVMKTVEEVAIDAENKIVTGPCYMMEASITQIHTGIQKGVKAFLDLV